MSLAMQRGRRSCISRADLLYVLVAVGPRTLAECAEFFGCQAPEPKPKDAEPKSAPEESRQGPVHWPAAEVQPANGPESTRPLRLRHHQQPDRAQDDDVPQWFREAKPFVDSIANAHPRAKIPSPKPPRLSPWPRLWPFLRAALGGVRPSNELDVDQIVRSLAQGKPLLCLPHIQRSDWAEASQTVVDLGLGLHCFWSDFNDLTERLVCLRGRAGLELLCFREGPLGPCADLRLERRDHERPYRLPATDVPILILSDLGLLANRTNEWLAFGRRLKQAGRRRPVVLMPCPERLWQSDLVEFFQPAIWDHGRRHPRLLGFRGRRPAVPRQGFDPGLDDLLAMASAAVRVEPGLLRSLRLLLPASRADVGSEAAIWRHGEVAADLLAFRLQPEALERHAVRLREKLQDPVAGSLFREALELIKTFHAGLPPEIRFEEALTRCLLVGEPPDADALAFMQRAAATVAHGTDYRHPSHLEAWFLRAAERQPKAFWSWEGGEPMGAALATIVSRTGMRDLPQGFDLGRFAWVPSERQTVELRWSAFQRLTVGMQPESAQGLLLARLQLAGFCLQWRSLGDAAEHLLDLRLDNEIPVPDKGELEIWGSFGRLTLDHLVKPAWAAAIAQGRSLGNGREYLDLVVAGPPRKRLRWHPPGHWPVRDAAGRPVAELWLGKGFFAVEDEVDELLEHGFRQPNWARSIGVDEFGLHADMECKGVVQRFRWIRPGSFMMGSPEDEPGRHDDEQRHEVVLTEGFWLADTACTQELWQAVMVGNPSQFKGARQPVENVSWDDVQRFLERLDQNVPGLGADLPTEAQWEYACRAGTTTPFSFGTSISTDQANFNGNRPHAGGPKGVWRGKTIDVRSLSCNPWGLRQMHGNVWEWCKDKYAAYPLGSVVDPVGPDAGRARVVRGGSWNSFGRNCRSAFRSKFGPSARYWWFGFRLARARTVQSG